MTTKQIIVAGIVKTLGHDGPCNVHEALPIQAQEWIAKTADSLVGTYPTTSVLEKMALALAEHTLRYDRQSLGL